MKDSNLGRVATTREGEEFITTRPEGVGCAGCCFNKPISQCGRMGSDNVSCSVPIWVVFKPHNDAARALAVAMKFGDTITPELAWKHP